MTHTHIRRAGIAATLAMAVCGTSALPSAYADAPGSGSATARAAYGGVTNISITTPQGSGLLGSTVASVLQPMVDALTYNINSVVTNSVRGLLNSSGNTADTTTGPYSYPTGPLANVAIPGILKIQLYGPSGSVAGNASGYTAQSQFTGAYLEDFNVKEGDMNGASASVTCPTPGTGTPSATLSLGTVSLIGGLVRAQLANGSNVLQVSINGGSYQSINGVSNIHVNTPNSKLTVNASGNNVQVAETITVSRLLGALGLGGLFSGMPGTVDVNSSNITVTITAGPGSSVGGPTSISAWGLQVGVDISGTIVVKSLNSLGILGGSATLTINSGIDATHNGNVMDLKLAYAACTAGNPPAGPQKIPPGLI